MPNELSAFEIRTAFLISFRKFNRKPKVPRLLKSMSSASLLGKQPYVPQQVKRSRHSCCAQRSCQLKEITKLSAGNNGRNPQSLLPS
jgi:hypothetical protein